MDGRGRRQPNTDGLLIRRSRVRIPEGPPLISLLKSRNSHTKGNAILCSRVVQQAEHDIAKVADARLSVAVDRALGSNVTPRRTTDPNGIQ